MVLANPIIDFFPPNGEAQPSPGPGQQHRAYVNNLKDFDPWVEHFRQHQVPVQLTHHSWQAMSIYLDDPNGYHLEVSVLFESEEDGRREIKKRGLQPTG